MFETPDVMKMAHAKAAHAANRQSIIAGNVANADTPGYRASDIESFSSFFERTRSEAQHTAGARQLSRLALPAAGSGLAGAEFRSFESAASEAPNGNSVSLEAEMVRGVETRHQHEMALSIYRTTSGILRAALGR